MACRTNPVVIAAKDAVALEISGQIDGLIQRSDVSIARAAQSIGISEPGMHAILKTESDPKLSTLVCVSLGFGHVLRVLFVPSRVAAVLPHPTVVG